MSGKMLKSSAYLQGSFVYWTVVVLLVQVLKRKRYSMEESSPQGIWNCIADENVVGIR